jgi:propionyl-CoA carboxylase alpha chain
MTTSRSKSQAKGRARRSKAPFRKILIANRGEIACRIMRTAKRMGIGTVAVYSEADQGALHVSMADEAVLIGPAASAESYLVVERILDAIKTTGADAVHPGFGFLAENADFARALESAGITFIGPSPEAIAAMGDKIESKKLANKAGVSTIPGHLGEVADAKAASRIAKEIGFPVMIKASAGGGGKGMRIARSAGEVAEGFASAQSEARSSFGDDRILLEKYVEQPRHIEIQVLADSHGNAIYLNERECSIQRRHQKVIEEAPSPFVDAAMRRAMGEQAIALAQAVDYRSAGTVEFVAGADKSFYFLEMNTRLQVEHPVTEMITGLDLVEQMIRVAAGEKLTIGQKDVALDGWSMEARVYAEDPGRGFLPSIGRLSRYLPPTESNHVRVDSGVAEGGEISMYYDPMIAKLVTHGATRDQAIERLSHALDEFAIQGVSHNVPFLASVAANQRFREGRLTTDFIADEYGDGYDSAIVPAPARDALVAVGAFVHMRAAERASRLTGRTDDGRYRPGRAFMVALGEAETWVELAPADDGYDVAADGRTIAIRAPSWRPGDLVFRGLVDGREVAVQVVRSDREAWRLIHGGAAVDVLVRSARAAELAARMPKKEPPDLSKFLLSPMPGLVVSIAVGQGDQVKAGEELCVIDAMKMENVLRAERDGSVADLKVAPGDSLAVDQVIMTFA